MPTYSYRCPNCAHAYDAFQRITDSTLTKCPECDTPGERQITGGAGIHFKGSGFYITDYGRSGAGKSEGEAKRESGDKPKQESGKKSDSSKTAKKKGAES
ncbi:MAG: FmdB family zinc ribbon protein [Gemmatimonadales bacterium]|jgi:putative FmdB family regulatory protein